MKTAKSKSRIYIAERIGVSRQAVTNARNDYLYLWSVLQFLQRKKRVTPLVKPKVTGEMEARNIALACNIVTLNAELYAWHIVRIHN